MVNHPYQYFTLISCALISMCSTSFLYLIPHFKPTPLLTKAIERRLIAELEILKEREKGLANLITIKITFENKDYIF